MSSENENGKSEMEITSQPKMEGSNVNEMLNGNNENTVGKEQNISSPIMYYNYNGFIPYPYIPMQTTAEGSFYQPVQAQVPHTVNPVPTATTNAIYSSPHPTPVPTSMIPMSRIPSNSSNTTPTNEMISTSDPNGLPTPSSNLPTSAIPPPPMTTMSAMPRIPFYPPQLSPSPLPIMPSNFNVAQPYASPSHGFAPLVPTMNAGPGPMNNHRMHYNKNHHFNNPNSRFNDNFNKNKQTTNNLYIKGLKPEINDESLQELCKQWGTIKSSKAIIDNKTNECKGYGFVMYETEEQAKLAMSELNKLDYQVSFAKESFSTRLKNLQDNVSTNVYMSNLPLTMDEKQFLELFKPFKVVSSIILYNETGASRGIGLVKLENREDAQTIIDKYNNQILPGGRNPLQVRFADSEAQKRLKGQAIHRKNYHNQHPRNNMSYYNQYRGMNNFDPRNKMPFPPQMAYMAQPVWPVLGETPMPIGMNSPYMMNPVNPMNPPQAIPSNLMEPSHIETQPQENVNMNVTNQPMNGNSINMNQNLNNSNEMNEPNFKSVSPSKNMNHQGINFSGILVNNAEQNCVASAVESNME
jgi:RNA recognition motif-containing protein